MIACPRNVLQIVAVGHWQHMVVKKYIVFTPFIQTTFNPIQRYHFKFLSLYSDWCTLKRHFVSLFLVSIKYQDIVNVYFFRLLF